MDYGGFEGEIPAGQYGAGHVRIVERGEWHPKGDPAAAIAAGKLDFRLDGEFLQGSWSLVRTGPAAPKAKWLLIKHDDPFARDADLDGLVAPVPDDETADKPKAVARKQKSRKAPSGNPTWAERALALPGARTGGPLAMPQLATLREHAPAGDDWLHEIKWDGYRLLARRDKDRIRLQSRNAVDWTGRFPAIERALAALPLHSLLLDAELVALGDDGVSDFALLQAALEGSHEHPVSAVAFDLMAVDGIDITGCTQLERKALLKDVLDANPSPWIAYGNHVVGRGADVLAKALSRGCEGIVSKRIDAPYEPGRHAHWIKVKGRDGFEAVVVGYTLPKGSRRGLGALLLAAQDRQGLRYVGRVGTGMGDELLQQLRRKLQPLEQDEPPVPLPAHVALPRGTVRWVRPRFVVEVEHRGWGKEGLLRQASFLRLRIDKSAPARAPVPGKGVKLSHPERVVYPKQGITKQQVADYYQSAARWLLAEVAGRPVSLLRAPDGIDGGTFFQKHHGGRMGAGVKALKIQEKSGKSQAYLMIDDAEGLLALVQMNALEFHPWGVAPGQPERPDRITFDLDPGPGVRWREIVQAAVDIHDHLAATGLRSHALLSGGKGVHVVVPLAGTDDWAAVKRFAKALAHVLAEAEPRRFVATAARSERSGRIFIDWLRNGRGATSVAPWSLRARDGAPVAMPVDWPGLAAARSAADFILPAATDYSAKLRSHPWGDYRARPQRLPGVA